MGWGGWDDIVPWTCKHTSLRVVGWGGWGGWDDNVFSTTTSFFLHHMISTQDYFRPCKLLAVPSIYDGSSKVLFPLLALNRNSMRDAFCFTCKKS